MGDWRSRLLEAVDATEQSDRSISLRARLGPNFVNELRNTSKVPAIDKVLKLGAALGLSGAYVVSGIELSQSDEELLQAFLSLDAENRRFLLDLARKLRANESV